MKLPSLPLVVLDTETTGFLPKVHRVMEYACNVVEGGKVTEEFDQLFSLPDGSEIPQAVQVLTHIYPEDLVDKPTFEETLPKIKKLCPKDCIIVGQNVGFDIGMLRGEGWDLTELPWIDTSMLASIVFPELSSYSLGHLSKELKLNHDPPHRALGDVRATLELLSRCVERLESLPAKDGKVIQELAARGPKGYQEFFAALTFAGKSAPKWLSTEQKKSKKKCEPIGADWPLPKKGTVQLIEEPLDPGFIPSVIAGLSGVRWLAVKNIEAMAERCECPKDVTILCPPEFVLSSAAKERLLTQETLTADELTIAIKLHLYQPIVRGDLPIHGGEYSVFTGKLAATKNDADYQALRAKADTGPAIISHQHLLDVCSDADANLPDDLSIVVDDASMLEDTATAAFAWTCHLPSLRAASQGNATLMKCTDLIELWSERIRNAMDLRYLAVSDLESRESIELKRMIQSLLKEDLSSQVKQSLSHLMSILNQDNLAGRIAWIEAMKDGSKTIKSVPEDIGLLLQNDVYNEYPTTLFIPPESNDNLPAILPPTLTATLVEDAALRHPGVQLRMPIGVNLDAVFAEPNGKTIVLVSSKRTIEDIFVKHGTDLEDDGVTLICQGFNGGQGRMRAEFASAKSPAFLVMTPWMFEGIELPPESVDRLVLQVMPFDHPSHAVIGRRAARFRDPFSDYSLPRLKHRLFRLMRTFRKHAKHDAIVDVLDDRLRTKAYGKEVAGYLQMLIPNQAKGQVEKGGQMAIGF